jgi:hypothetical protein
LWTSDFQGSKQVKQMVASYNSYCSTTCSTGTCVQGDSKTTGGGVPFGCLAPYPAYCGDTTCDAGETAGTCPIDCAPACGDGMCNGTEDCSTCPADCSSTATPATCCGDLACNRPEENHTICPKDCK